jgi:hypothetical protein
MVPIKQLPDTFTIAQKYFIERVLELVNSKTIDTYRVRLHNPNTILTELSQVLLDWENNKLKRFETVQHVIDESNSVLQEEEELDFTLIDRDYFISLLTSAQENEFKKLLSATNLVIHGNKNYLDTLFTSIQEEVDSCNINETLATHDLLKLERLISYLITELLSIGYSKTYLNNSLWSIFIKNINNKTYDECFNVFMNLKDKDEEVFSVVFKLIIPKEQIRNQLNIIEEENIVFNQTTIVEVVDGTNQNCKAFLEISNLFSKHLLIKVSSKDYYTVIEQAKERLSNILDQVFLGYNQPEIRIYKEALVIGSKKPNLSKSNPVNYRTFGSYISNQSLYEAFQEKTKYHLHKPPYIK